MFDLRWSYITSHVTAKQRDGNLPEKEYDCSNFRLNIKCCSCLLLIYILQSDLAPTLHRQNHPTKLLIWSYIRVLYVWIGIYWLMTEMMSLYHKLRKVNDSKFPLILALGTILVLSCVLVAGGCILVVIESISSVFIKYHLEQRR